MISLASDAGFGVLLEARTLRLGRVMGELLRGALVILRVRLRSRENEERFSGSDIEIKELSFAELELRRREVGKWEGTERNDDAAWNDIDRKSVV